jgi:hypothetical protein
MQWELGEFDLQSVIFLELLDTPGDEITPRSDKIGEYLENEWFGHSVPPSAPFDPHTSMKGYYCRVSAEVKAPKLTLAERLGYFRSERKSHDGAR